MSDAPNPPPASGEPQDGDPGTTGPGGPASGGTAPGGAAGGGTAPGGAAGGGGLEGLDPKIGGLLAYLLFGWIGGLIMLLTQRHPEVRFHGAQSILTTIALVAVSIALWVVGVVLAFIPVIGWLGGILVFLASAGVSIAGLVLWIVLCIKGYNLEHFKLPVIGGIAERWASG